MFEVDISDLSPEVKRELIAGRHARRVADMEDAYRRQHLIAYQAGEHRSIDGLGQVKAAIDLRAFHYWGQRLGYQCWNDKQFVREFLRDNPAARVKCGGTKTMVGFRQAFASSPAAKRFHKTYACNQS